MDTSQQTTLRYAVVMLVAAGLVVGALKWMNRSQDDVSFCRQVFRGLVSGSGSVQSRIDWEHLKALDVDIGAAYTKYADEKGKASYRKSFIRGFSYGFAQSHAKPESFVRWRVQERTEGHVVVATDYEGKGKTLLLTIPASGKKKIQAIQWAS